MQNRPSAIFRHLLVPSSYTFRTLPSVVNITLSVVAGGAPLYGPSLDDLDVRPELGLPGNTASRAPPVVDVDVLVEVVTSNIDEEFDIDIGCSVIRLIQPVYYLLGNEVT